MKAGMDSLSAPWVNRWAHPSLVLGELDVMRFGLVIHREKPHNSISNRTLIIYRQYQRICCYWLFPLAIDMQISL